MYVSNLVDSVLQKLYYEDHNVSFFKHYNTFSIPLNVVNQAMLKSGNIVQILYHEFEPGVIKGAYCPMMDWINALYERYYSSEQTFETFLDSAGVYSLHKNIYVKYRENGVCQRIEEVIPIENLSFSSCACRSTMLRVLPAALSRVNSLSYSMTFNQLRFA